jgi:hypothetical protein
MVHVSPHDLVPIFGQAQYSIRLEHLDFAQRYQSASLALISSTLTILVALEGATFLLTAQEGATFPLTRHVQASCHCPVLLTDPLKVRDFFPVLLADDYHRTYRQLVLLDSQYF